MRRKLAGIVVPALVFAAAAAAVATATRAGAPDQAPAAATLADEQDAVASLRLQTAALPGGDRRDAEKLLREAAGRLAQASELVPTDNPRLAQYARHQAELAKNRIEATRRVVEQGGSR